MKERRAGKRRPSSGFYVAPYTGQRLAVPDMPPRDLSFRGWYDTHLPLVGGQFPEKTHRWEASRKKIAPGFEAGANVGRQCRVKPRAKEILTVDRDNRRSDTRH